MQIQHEDNGKKGRFFINENGKDLAEIVYTWASPTVIIIHHTEVDPQLKGQGVGNKLVDEIVAWARKNNLKIDPLCPFANAVLRKKEEYHDVLFK